jgi:hypothetical protein
MISDRSARSLDSPSPPANVNVIAIGCAARARMSPSGQTRPGRADGRFGHVGYPPTATDFSGASNFAMCQQRSRSNTVAGTKSHG